ncbi:protein FAM246C-like [Schistocerca nitens]|uniref:protein FAM246C-like n=1 Tax=Schistocerca nitens TaxID=7011 RepID=UPI0021182DFF|nr:protein FAM246C-like [Schistocerca nitens]
MGRTRPGGAVTSGGRHVASSCGRVGAGRGGEGSDNGQRAPAARSAVRPSGRRSPYYRRPARRAERATAQAHRSVAWASSPGFNEGRAPRQRRPRTLAPSRSRSRPPRPTVSVDVRTPLRGQVARPVSIGAGRPGAGVPPTPAEGARGTCWQRRRRRRRRAGLQPPPQRGGARRLAAGR